MQNCEELHKKSMDETIDKRLVYNDWAKNYDEYVKSLNYTGPKEVVNCLLSYINNKNQKQKILDFGCGTGLVGEELSKSNYNFVLDGIDVSDKMIEIADERKIYYNIYLFFFVKNLDIFDYFYFLEYLMLLYLVLFY